MARQRRNLPKGPSSHRTPTPTTIPPPFSPAPASLKPLLSTLDKRKVYITHIDTFPAAFKKQIFTVPVILNAVILALLLWRAYAIAPTYISILLSTLRLRDDGTRGQSSDSSSNGYKELAWVIVRRAGMFMLDFLLLRFIWNWPVSFFLERPGNPVRWRWRVGFRDREVVVRVSRGWGAEDLLPREKEGKRGGENAFFKTRVLPAVLDEWLTGKTGYLMMDRSWDLEFAGMVGAQGAVDRGEFGLKQLHKRVFVWVEGAEGGEGSEGGCWAVWDVDGLEGENGAGLSGSGSGSGIEAEEVADEENVGRKKILEFKDRLTAMKKEDLFYRWVELVQYESSQPGGFTPERQVAAAAKVKELFDEHGVDFSEFAKLVGVGGEESEHMPASSPSMAEGQRIVELPD